MKPSRVAEEELDIVVEIVELLGAFEHRYERSDVAGVGSKHYLANGHVIDVVDRKLDLDDQHDEFRVFRSAPEPCHEYVSAYIEAASTVNW